MIILIIVYTFLVYSKTNNLINKYKIQNHTEIYNVLFPLFVYTTDLEAFLNSRSFSSAAFGAKATFKYLFYFNPSLVDSFIITLLTKNFNCI